MITTENNYVEHAVDTVAGVMARDRSLGKRFLYVPSYRHTLFRDKSYSQSFMSAQEPFGEVCSHHTYTKMMICSYDDNNDDDDNTILFEIHSLCPLAFFTRKLG
jgi:hypothetical protein